MRGVILLLVVLAACNDLRDFERDWRGPRVGDSPALRVGVTDRATAELALTDVDTHGLRGRLTVDLGDLRRLVDHAEVTSLPGAEADALATMTYTGAPLRVFLAFVPVTDGLGDALAFIGLYEEARIEIRLLRGGAAPIYAIFALSPQT